jgi:hypothetical protein
MTYAPSTYWDHFFRSRRQAGTDLDWGEQWTAVFGPILQAYRVQTVLDLGCGSGNDVRRLAHLGLGDVRLEFVEIASGTRNTHSKKCVWRGVAQV